MPNGSGIPFVLELVPKFAELPPILPPDRVAVVLKLSEASVVSGQPSLSESVSKEFIMPSLSVSILSQTKPRRPKSLKKIVLSFSLLLYT